MTSETDKTIKKLFKSLLQRFQKGLEESMKKSDFIFDNVNLLYYHFHKTSLKRTGSSYRDSFKWLKNEKATINPKNSDNNSFQYALTVALNYQSIKKTLKEYQKLSLLLIIITRKK